MSNWHKGPLISVDVETTGVDVETDRIVTASRWVIRPTDPDPARRKRCCSWLVNPGVPIPEEATRIHGVTTAKARADGQPAAQAVRDIAADVLYWVAETRGALIVYNAPYDLTLLHRELSRHGHGDLADQVADLSPVVDPLVLDKEITPRRSGKGRRRLAAVAEIYGVPLSEAEAHGSAADALAAARVAYQMGQRTPRIAGMGLGELHEAQVGWAAAQAEGLAGYFARNGIERDVDPAWPLRPPPRQPRQEVLR